MPSAATFRKIGLVSLWFIAALLIVRGGTRPGHLILPPDRQWSYPLGGVLFFLGVSLAELAVAWLILRPSTYHRSFGRARAGLAVFIPWAIVSLNFGMHAPGYVSAHLFWILALVLVLAASFTISAGSAAWRALRSGRRERAA